MGDRISVQFKDGRDESVVLFAHWAGKDFLSQVEGYIRELDKEVPKKQMFPLERREAGTVMLDFIRWLSAKNHFQNGRVMSSYYLEADEKHGDNSDNGHWVWDLELNEWVVRGRY